MQLLVGLLIFGLGITVFLRLNFTITTVRGNSMSPTLMDGDRVLTCNFYPLLWLQRSQIVISNSSQIKLPSAEAALVGIEDWEELKSEIDDWESPNIEDLIDSELTENELEYSKIIKRLTGLPGDTVTIPLSSLSTEMQALLQSCCDANGNLVWTVPKDHCFLRGDGLFSIDSLLLGCIPLYAITGIMLLKLPQRLLVSDTLSITS